MKYDLIIIGAGPAGLTAALYAGRAGLSCLVLESQFVGGQVAITYEVDNYPGTDGTIDGASLMAKFEQSATRFGAEFVNDAVVSLDLLGDEKIVTTANGKYTAKSVLFAMGAHPRELGIDREVELRGAGVSYCATCDGAFFRGKDVAVIGGGETAVEDATFLARLCKTVYIVHRRDEFRATKTSVSTLSSCGNIKYVWNSTIESINGKDTVEGITVKDKLSGISTDIAVGAIFVAVGTIPNSEIVPSSIAMEDGYIITDEHMQTNIPGVFAAGDVRVTPLRQIVTAASDGAIAAYSAAKMI